jgi:methylaspartate ammonia-lyase
VLEHSLQAKPSLESTQVAYVDQIGRIADQVSALVEGGHWTLRTNVERGCGSAYAGTDAEQVYLNVAFSAPIPDAVWPQAVQIVRDGAIALAAADYRDFVDESGIHAIQVASPDGGDIWLGTAKTASLTARSDCRISERTNAA